MKALSLYQPYASLVAWGDKKNETRSWGTGHRGPLAIHATAKLPQECCNLAYEKVQFGHALRRQGVSANYSLSAVTKAVESLPRAAIIAVVEVVEVFEIAARGTSGRGWHLMYHPDGQKGKTAPDKSDSRDEQIASLAVDEDEIAFGDFRIGRYVWRLGNVRVLPEPVPCRGMQGLWTVPEPQRLEVEAALAALPLSLPDSLPDSLPNEKESCHAR